MEVLQQIEKDFNQSLKNKDELALLVLRQLKTAISTAEIAKNREKLTEEELIKILRSEVKKRKDAADLYKKGGRDELAEKEIKEITVVEKYLPAQLGEDQVRQKVSKVIEKINANGLADMGKVIGAVMKELAGQADGGLVSSIVKEELSKE